MLQRFVLKGQGHVLYTKFFRNNDFAVFLIGHITEIFHYFSQNEGFEDGLLNFVKKQTKPGPPTTGGPGGHGPSTFLQNMQFQNLLIIVLILFKTPMLI